MRNIRLRLAYDGTRYVGWQVQPNGQSVKACLEQAIEAVKGFGIRPAHGRQWPEGRAEPCVENVLILLKI